VGIVVGIEMPVEWVRLGMVLGHYGHDVRLELATGTPRTSGRPTW
jgi:hypothetical protein